MSRGIRLVLLAASFAAAARPAAGAAPYLSQVIEKGSPSLFTFTCGNGLPAVVDARPGSRTVFAMIGVRAGSRDDPLRLSGMSHLVEHLLFKEGHGGPGRRNPAFSALRAAGALVNASTDFEMTEYHADLPADRFAEGWDALATMVTGAAFDRKDLDRERQVVLQEAALGKTDPLAIVAYSVLRRVFPDDPIGRPIIGLRRTLRSISREDLEAHYRRHYVPAGMFAVVVGDVNPALAAARIQATLGALPASGGRRAPYPEPAPRVEPLYQFRTLVSQSYLLVGALTGGETSPDAPALRLIATVLAGGRASRLHRRLVDEEALASEVIAVELLISNAGAFGAGLAVDPRRAERARAALLDEMGRLAREPALPDEIETARTLLRGRLAMQFETNQGIAEFRARRLLSGQPVGRDQYLARLDGPGPEELRAVASRHWGEGAGGPAEIQVLPARGLGKLIAALRFLIFRRL